MGQPVKVQVLSAAPFKIRREGETASVKRRKPFHFHPPTIPALYPKPNSLGLGTPFLFMYHELMEPSLIHTLIGNLGVHGDFSTQAPYSTAAKQKNKLKKGVQIVVNVNGVPTEKRNVTDKKAAGTYKAGFHAIFLEDGSVYFGKLQRFPSGAQFVVLENVYYLRSIEDVEVLNFDLIKLGSEIHSPEDKMHININKILFWEKLQDDGPIVTAILKTQQ